MILEALMIIAGLFGLGVVGGLERGLLGIGPAVILLILTAAAEVLLYGIRRATK